MASEEPERIVHVITVGSWSPSLKSTSSASAGLQLVFSLKWVPVEVDQLPGL